MGNLPRQLTTNNNPHSQKISILVQVSLLAALGTLNTAIINPAYSQLATTFGITLVQASYQTTVVVALNGVGPLLLWIPLADAYGRRPVYLASTLLGFASALGAAYAAGDAYGQLLGARVVNGLFPAAMALGPLSVVDLFPEHQRGRAMGLFTVILTSGAHVAPIVGGLVGQFLGWRWIFKLAAIMDGVVFLVILFGLPETLYVVQTTTEARNNASEQQQQQQLTTPTSPSSPVPHATAATTTASRKTRWSSYLSRLKPYAGPFPGRRLRPRAFVWPALRMAKYPSVLFPAAYYSAQYGFASILPAVTVAAIFKEAFGWNTLEIGLAYGGALTIGGILGESVAGVVLDRIVKRAHARARQQDDLAGENHHENHHDADCTGQEVEPEARLQAIWTGAVLVPVGLLIYGFAIEHRVHWFVPLFGMAVSVFGLQPIATTCYTYSIECCCYSSSSSPNQGDDRVGTGDGTAADVAALFNFLRQCFGLTFAFYVVDLCERIGYHVAFVLFVIWGSVLGFVPIVVLMWRGKQIRAWVEKRERRETEA